MKCAKCGQEFGNGSTCINCGADRVSAFGEFQGFGNGSIVGKSPNDGNIQLSVAGYTVCRYCGTPIPIGSKYCPQCKTQLLIECPNCKHICSTEFPGCPNCGVDRNEFIEQLREAQRKQAEREQKEREEREKREMQERLKIEMAKQFEIEKLANFCRESKSEICQEYKKQKRIEIVGIVSMVLLSGGMTTLSVLLPLDYADSWGMAILFFSSPMFVMAGGLFIISKYMLSRCCGIWPFIRTKYRSKYVCEIKLSDSEITSIAKQILEIDTK